MFAALFALWVGVHELWEVMDFCAGLSGVIGIHLMPVIVRGNCTGDKRPGFSVPIRFPFGSCGIQGCIFLCCFVALLLNERRRRVVCVGVTSEPHKLFISFAHQLSCVGVRDTPGGDKWGARNCDVVFSNVHVRGRVTSLQVVALLFWRFRLWWVGRLRSFRGFSRFACCGPFPKWAKGAPCPVLSELCFYLLQFSSDGGQRSG